MTNFVPENSLTTAFHAPTRISLRTNPAPIGSSLQPVGDAPFRGETDRTLALRQARDDDRGDERSIRPAPGPARRNVRSRTHRSRKSQHFDRRHEKIPLSYLAEPFHRIGLHPRRRPGDALHLVAGGLPYGLPFLRNRTTGAPALPFDERNPQPDRVAARTGTAHQRRFHGHGRTARQPGQSAAGARSPHFGVGIRLVAHTNHGFDRRCRPVTHPRVRPRV